jgi:hypothetical protein
LIEIEDAWLRVHDRGRTVGERRCFVNAPFAGMPLRRRRERLVGLGQRVSQVVFDVMLQ